jgi:hypothetical protein
MSNIDIAVVGVVRVGFLGFAGTLFYSSSRPPPLASRDSPRH